MRAWNYKSLVGMTFGDLEVIKEGEKRSGSWSLRWVCKCSCGAVKQILGKSLISGATRSCGECKRRKATYWCGYGEISGTYWGHIKRNGSVRGRDGFHLTIQEAWGIFLAQDRKCAISGVPIIFSRNPNKKKGEQTASLDRIDNSLGYVLGNIQWVHKTINYMKSTMSTEEFVRWCALVYKNVVEGEKAEENLFLDSLIRVRDHRRRKR